MNITARCILFSSLGVSALTTCAQSTPVTRYPLNTDSIVRALNADGLVVQADEIRMLTQASAAVDHPTLQLVGADRMSDGHLRMRLRCQKANECLPFSVAIDGSKGWPPTGVTSLPEKLASPAVLEARLAIPQPVPAFSAPVVAASPIHAGAKLTLLMDEGHMHIHLPVVAMDNSTVGSELRVCTPDHKRIFRATAMDASTVRGIAE